MMSLYEDKQAKDMEIFCYFSNGRQSYRIFVIQLLLFSNDFDLTEHQGRPSKHAQQIHVFEKSIFLKDSI